ncbi:cyclohexanecarboxylate-CoA ligase [Nocardioides seonyuensis]|uniref:Cyclohexanecarboxylate-CoA ligase n=1 Tax=Nocardioides seonyuensis TaxID=2518371 RepID=A0A4P7II64_9ACTN|nr:AMP-binding protein [Nocardioides seonyuensis]QBX55917.1 cyclohexanecarboxylate-CoA ligase [Nocardioides seonyuensis]
MSAVLKTIQDRYTEEQIASFYDEGFWKSSSLNAVVQSHALERPDAPFIFDSTTSYTYGEMAEGAVRLAAGLKRTGLERGDRIAVQLPNWTEFALVVAAASRIGVIVVPIMPIYRDAEVSYVISHSGAVMAVTCGEFRGFDYVAMFDRLRPECPELGQVFVARADAGLAPALGKPLDGLRVEGDLTDLEAEIGPDSSPDDAFLIVYTSGTTSRPKGCFHTFNTVRASAEAIAHSLDYGPSDVQFGPSPVGHGTGLITSFALPLVTGASSYLMEVWEPEEALRRIQQYGCTTAVTATAFLQMLMTAFDPAKHDASSLRRWVCAGAPIPSVVVEKSRQIFSGCQTLSLYGRTENYLTTMCTVRDEPERSVNSDGSALRGAEVKIVDERGQEVPRGEEGDIAYRGPSHMIEYFRDDVETKALFTPDGFSKSGDLGRMDEDGYVRVTGRLKDIVIRGGMNISAREIEEHLLRMPGVSNVAVVGMPDERLGEKVCAYIVSEDPDNPPTLEEVIAHLKEHKVATQKLPERLEVVSEFPVTATGKIQKHVLRADIAEKVS